MFFANRQTAFQITKKVGSFSLDSAQLEVGILSTRGGDSAKGVSLVFPSISPGRFGPRGTYSYIFSSSDASRFLAFVDQVLADNLPVEFQFSGDVSGRWFSDGNCKWVVTKFVEKWHGGGGYKGRIDNSWSYTITESSTRELRECVIEFFGVAA